VSHLAEKVDEVEKKNNLNFETVARLQSMLLGEHLLLAAESWQKPKSMSGSAGTGTRKVLLAELDVT